MNDDEFATQHPFITAVGAFKRYPKLGTIEHLPYQVRKDGLRWFDAFAVEDVARHEIPDDLTDCDACGGQRLLSRFVKPDSRCIAARIAGGGSA